MLFFMDTLMIISDIYLKNNKTLTLVLSNISNKASLFLILHYILTKVSTTRGGEEKSAFQIGKEIMTYNLSHLKARFLDKADCLH